jgi:hypothetical protein
MTLRFMILPTMLLGTMLAGRTQAHFLFVRILPPAEGGRAAEVYFSELAEAGDPRFVDKIAGTQLWLQKSPGVFEPLVVHKAHDRLRAWLPASGSTVVVGRCQYGVLARPMQTPFLLRHFPKAVAGNPDELNRMKAHGKLPLEIVMTSEGGGLQFVALKDGQPVPRADFITVDAKLNNTKLTAGTDGKAAWKPSQPGVYSVYTRDTRKESGTADGKNYEEVRDFATVAFTWPLERTDADDAAVSLFEEAIAARAQWRHFPGFTARIAGNLDGRAFTGKVEIDAKGEVSFSDDKQDREESVSGWVQEQLESIVLHRMARPASPDRARPVLRFGESRADHPFGRLLIFDGGKFASSYRIKERQIMVVNRDMGKENMTITTLENHKNAEGKYLPKSYVVRYWDAQSGRLTRSETVQDEWQRLGSWDLPVSRTVTAASDAGLSTKSFTLSKHELTKAGSSTKD